MSISSSLKDVASRISGEDVVLVLGDVDTGKTFLIKNLWSQIGGEIVDGDVGQSDIGPPAVISRGNYQMGAKEGYFVGDVSPRGNLLQVLTGLKLMVSRANRPCLIDTDGYIRNGAALAFKSEMVNLIFPTKLLLLQRSNELEYYKIYEQKGIEVIEIKAQTSFKKNREQRIEVRENAFSNYFKGAEIRGLKTADLRFERLSMGNGKPLDTEVLTKMMGCTVLGAWEIGDQAKVIVDGFAKSLGAVKRALNVEYVKLINFSNLKNLLVGCLDLTGDLYLGILKYIDQDRADILTPANYVSIVQTGSIQIDKYGKQLDRVRF